MRASATTLVKGYRHIFSKHDVGADGVADSLLTEDDFDILTETEDLIVLEDG